MLLFYIKRYWSSHRKKLIYILCSIIIFVASFAFSILNTRSELREKYNSILYKKDNYAIALHNVTDEQSKEILDIVDESNIGILSVSGKISTSRGTYSVGKFENENAQDFLCYPLIKGSFPKNENEIAIPEFILRDLGYDEKIGEKITLDISLEDGTTKAYEFMLSGILSNDIYKRNVEYTSYDGGITVQNNVLSYDEYPFPSILWDIDTDEKYYNYAITADDKVFFSEESIEDFDINVVEKLYQITDYVSSGSKNEVISGFCNSDKINYATSSLNENVKFTRIISFLLMIVSLISMIAAIISVMPERIQSLKMLHTIGLSKSGIVKCFILENSIFWFVSNIIGVSLACLLHETVLQIQKLSGLDTYRGYFVEYAVKVQTQSPFIMPIVSSFAFIVLATLASIIYMSGNNKSKIGHSNKKYSINRLFFKVVNLKSLNLIITLSVVIVIFTTMFTYCFYTLNGKGTSSFSIGDTDTSENYYVANGVDIKENNFDCTVNSDYSRLNSLAIPEKFYGISEDEVETLEEKGSVFAYGLYPDFSIIYDNEKVPDALKSAMIEYEYDFEFIDEYKGRSFCSVNLIIINDAFMKKLGDYNSDDVIFVSDDSGSPFKKGDILPAQSTLCDSDGRMMTDSTKKFNIEITALYNTNEYDKENDDFINQSGILNFGSDYALFMTAEKAESLGYYNPAYTTLYVDFSEEMSNSEIKETINSTINNVSDIVTVYDLKSKMVKQQLSENLNVFIVFIFMLLISLIGINNILEMKMELSIKKLHMLNDLGMSIKSIKKLISQKIIKITLVAIASGSVISLVFQSIIKFNYNKYYKLLEREQILIENPDFPNYIYTGIDIDSIDKSSELYSVEMKMNSLKNMFFLDKELWLPNIIIPLIVIAIIVILIIFIIDLKSLKNLEKRLSHDKD
jgi:putative ABC transport system permease protein